MAKKYKIRNTSIKDLASDITDNKVILPALQREYIWKQRDICRLFDSLMQGYPINTMMFWNAKNLRQKPISFYRFLNPQYQEGVSVNEPFNIDFVKNEDCYNIVIDGQQRITSLLIGLCGSYQTPKANNPSYLHLHLNYQPNENDEFKYDFKFLTSSKVQERSKKGEIWFKVNDIISDNYREKTTANIPWGKKGAIEAVLENLSRVITNTNVINYYEIKNDEIDEVLEVFVRTNSGGYTLKKSDLLMSALTVKWGEENSMNAREYVNSIIKEVRNRGYEIDKDWIFNAFLMLTDVSNLNLKPSAFMGNNAPENQDNENIDKKNLSVPEEIYRNKDNIKDSIIKAFELVSSYGILEKGLTTKLAIIPIAYFIYKNNLMKTSILPINKMKDVYKNIRTFLFRAIAKNLFEASTVDILTKIRGIISEKSKAQYFPYSEIENEYDKLAINNPKDIDMFMDVKKQNAFPLLNIIYALAGIQLDNSKSYDVDHIHPKSIFTSNQIKEISFSTDEDKKLALDGITYDKIVNLELLEYDLNRSKNKKQFESCLDQADDAYKDFFIKNHFMDGLQLKIQDFGTFVEGRKERLQKVLVDFL